MTDPHISEFSPPDLPIVPALIRSNRKQMKRNNCPPSPHSPFVPKQILVDVTPFQGEKGVRKHIDACLNAIEKSYFQSRPPRKGDTNIKTASNRKEEPREQSIHRVDNRLIEDYLQSIQKDYQIRNRFGSEQNKQESHKRCNTVDNRRKQYLQLTQSSKREKRSFSSKKPQNMATPSRYTHYSRPISTPPQISSFGIEDKIAHKKYKGFRYCINCEHSVEAFDVQRHENEECQDFKRLYSLSFRELQKLVEEKISRIAQKVKSELKQLRTEERGRTKINKITEKTLDELEDYLKNFEQSKSEQKFSKFRKSLNNQYEQVLQGANKLHWFSQILSQLRERSRDEGNEGLIRKGEGVPLSPINQLDPNIGTKLFSF